MSESLGMKAFGVLVHDRETGASYGLHLECLEVLRAMLTDAGESGWRLVEMGPAAAYEAAVCGYTPCGAPLSVAASVTGAR